jgi:hypothetical protein
MFEFVIHTNSPFSIVENEYFRRLIVSYLLLPLTCSCSSQHTYTQTKIMTKDFVIPKRMTLTRRILDLYNLEAKKIGRLMLQTDNFALTFDGGQDMRSRSVYAITMHFFDDSEQLSTVCAGLVPVPKVTIGHTSQRIAEVVMRRIGELAVAAEGEIAMRALEADADKTAMLVEKAREVLANRLSAIVTDGAKKEVKAASLVVERVRREDECRDLLVTARPDIAHDLQLV